MSTIVTGWMLPAAAIALAAFGAECAGADSAPTPLQSGRACGTVIVIAQDPPVDPASRQVEQCFQNAYAACAADSTLTLETRGTDLIARTTFTLKAGSPCGIAAVAQSHIVGGQENSRTFNCARLADKDGGLLFTDCGRAGDIYIPPPAR